jgi:HAD superfamily hydrolase (TIGR01549 family)
MIKNLFLDVGGVILDEKEFEYNSAKIITEIIKLYVKNYTIESYWKDVNEAVYTYTPKIYDYILYKNISNKNDFNKLKKQYKEEIKKLHKSFYLMDGIKELLENISKEYRIGILGQYGMEFKVFLENSNLLHYFTYKEVQDDYKITKPDPRYFQAILEKCNCKPQESIMVGDRIDKDIIPAKMVGMKTIRIKNGIHKNQEPRIPEEIADLTVGKIREINIETIKAMDSREDGYQ